jgi:hypothetical protein
LQRCHFHVKQNLQTKLTKHPATAAGQDLQALAQWLARVTTWDDLNKLRQRHTLPYNRNSPQYGSRDD